MEYSVSMHVLNGLDKLVHVMLDALFRQVVRPPLNSFVHILLHELEDEGQPSRRLVIQDLNQLYNVRVRIQSLQRLDLSQIVNLINAIKMAFHAFDSNILPISQTLRL